DSHTIHYGHIVNNVGEVIDEVMVTVMKSPRTFTREDVVEVNCHGGLVSVQRVLEEVLCAGARLAEPGEFTKRAF
ncbi:MAG TPA: tRNA uridine-5-carboxymethylaminomethyl(34) synthesis GTPase MnmE, partial [Paenibacillaceae bacterium]|nr:tRNA uridine-5-carboxymethylaminomethyl(34) synthesis GTPase MnmE [Paenibacillaceae bacterium]